jgi:NAD(P)H dehydrogenase (quinone)
MYAVTGATGQLGRLVLDSLLATTAPDNIVALARDPAKLSAVAARGVIVRPFDYNAPEKLGAALEGVERLLIISSNEIGRRAQQHGDVIAAAKAAGVSFIAYTSILDADKSPIGLAVEHRATEEALKQSSLSYALLRNGWYTENYTVSAAPSIEHGAVIGSTGQGRVSAATRADYAAAAAAVLTGDKRTATYELAGDEAFTLTDFAAALAKVSGKPVAYVNMPEAEFRGALEGMGLPGPLAAMLAQSSASAAGGALFNDSKTLSRLISRPTTPMIETVKKALAG